MSKYGVLLIGGMRTHQENHAEIFAANPHCRLVAAADESNIPAWISKLNEDLAMVHGIPYIPDLDKALARDDIDIVSATPQVERRGRIGARCIEAGKHVYFDKPLAGTVEDLDLIVNAANSSKVITQMFCQNLSPWVRDAEKTVVDG
jgi:predicted dehydrogenase